MALQSLVVALLVLACSVYAAWTLMPAAARRAIALQLLKLPLPGVFEAPLQRAASKASGCGCDGCDRASVPPRARRSAAQAPVALPGDVKPIVFQRRVR